MKRAFAQAARAARSAGVRSTQQLRFSRTATRVFGAATAAVALAAPVVLCAGVSQQQLRDIDDRRADARFNKRENWVQLSALLDRHDPAHECGPLLWRAARAAYDLALEADTPKDEKKKLLETAMKLIGSAKAVDRNSGEVFRWSGIVLSELGNFLSTTEYIKNSFVIRDDWLQALSINPADATAHNLLGRWAMNVADMGYLKRKAAAALFAEPPSATFEEALAHFLDAEKIDPNFWKANQVNIAEAYLKLNNKAEGIKWLVSALGLPTTSSNDLREEARALDILKPLDAAAHKQCAEAIAKRKAQTGL